MSRAERRGLVERAAPALPVSRQCRLLAVSRASVYRRPAEISEEDCTIMALIDRQYLARPYYGSRRISMAGDPGPCRQSQTGPAPPRLTGMIEALVADHARRDKQGELHGGVMRSRR